MFIICVISSGIFLYKILFDVSHIQSLMEIGVPFELSLYSGILAIMCEYRPRVTPTQIKIANKTENMGLFCLILITAANAILIVVASFAQPHL